MVQAVVVCYALFDPLFVAIVLVGSGEVDAEVHHDQLSHECQHFLLDHFLDPVVSITHQAMNVNTFFSTIFLIPIVCVYTSS